MQEVNARLLSLPEGPSMHAHPPNAESPIFHGSQVGFTFRVHGYWLTLRVGHDSVPNFPSNLVFFFFSPLSFATAASQQLGLWGEEGSAGLLYFMGTCWSSVQFKGEGVKSKHRGKGGKESSSKVSSSASAPPTPRRTQGEILQSSSLKSFSFSELKTATRNFRPDSVVGEGGFGCVFKGWIDEHSFTPTKPGTGLVIAVKRLNQEGLQGHKEWLAEINYLGQLYHPNLVKLVGYCLEDDHRLLVYEFMSRGSLENHLFRRNAYFQPLPWRLRMKVALGAAKGLAFLHSDKVKVIFRDFKPSNILLDSNYNVKLSDFGLAKDGPADDESHVSTRIMGTYGYAAPEYMATGHLSERSDVYSFGVVLLEMMSGRRVVDKNRPPGEHNLVTWARPFLTREGKVLSVMDTQIEGQYTLVEALRVATVVVRCLAKEPRSRPAMDEVIRALEKLQQDAKCSTQNYQNPRLPRQHGNGVPMGRAAAAPSPRPSHASPLHL